MSEKTLYLEIFQPFAQYRNPFTFYYAQTYPLPPKSTIIGMLQNLVDDYYGHVHGVENWWKLKVSIHGGFESIFWGYQQLIKGETSLSTNGLLNKHDRNPLGKVWHLLYHSNIKAQRTPVYQQELFNGHLFIFLQGNADLVGLIKSSLENQKKVLYLGRSEDVMFIKNIVDIDACNIEKEIKTVKKNIWLGYPTYIKLKDRDRGKKFPIKNEKFPVYSIPTRVEFWNSNNRIKNKAELSKETERKVDFETVIYTGLDYVVYLSGEVKIEIFKINLNGKDFIFKIPVDFGWL
ncbi:MAG: CRISPR-associated protein Cas5 [Candidatus Aenigmarchaeota archaeon]|nr:CRISPR-associated protein Cas5 [Candidatus Aenigmarchaeota archaeon]